MTDFITVDEQDRVLEGLTEAETRELAASHHNYCVLAKTTSRSTALAKALRVHNRIYRTLWDRQDKEAARMPQHEDNAPAVS